MVRTVNPATGAFIREFAVLGDAQVEAVLARAESVFFQWRGTTLNSRLDSLRRFEQLLRRERSSLARSMAVEMGKPLAQGLAEVDKSAESCQLLGQHYPAWVKSRQYITPSHIQVALSPLGVLLGIMPWNFPLWQVVRFAVPALLNGNVVLLKHAPNTWGTAELIEALFHESFPANTYSHLPIAIGQIERVIADPRVRGASLTGSRAAGSAVAAACGRAIKPCVLELGGNDAYLVFADADVDLAARVCAEARLQNSGQSCIAAKRFIVHRSLVDEFTEKLVANMAGKVVGDPLDPGVNLGPLAREDLRETLHEQVSLSEKKGAKVRLGGKIPAGPGFFYPATVLTGVWPGMPAFDDELFGPVAAIVDSPSDEESLRLANLSRYGLGGAVFSRNTERARELALLEFDTGMVAINDFVRSEVLAPFGGVKESGIGRELGPDGCFEFVNIKTIRSES